MSAQSRLPQLWQLYGLNEDRCTAMYLRLRTQGVLEAISKGAAQSWQMDNRWPTMAQGKFDFGFAVDWMRKDLGLLLDEATRNGATLEMTAMVDRFYAEVQAMGGGRQDLQQAVDFGHRGAGCSRRDHRGAVCGVYRDTEAAKI